ncbi:hypothetical protein B566_EDAN018016 [Ephemera danica]|nr:hypothetical protein B566_EDAN018016 [Ephemera danica]
MDKSFAELGLKIYFVLQDNQEPNETSPDFLEAFQKCHERELKENWITESQIREMKLTDRHICVLQKFDNSSPKTLYSYLKNQKCMVLGPQCVLQCLMRCIPTPTGPEPVYNLAMEDIVVCVTGFNACQKASFMESMGGHYVGNFESTTTHLVICNGTGTTTAKYNIAAENRIPVMNEQWIHECWDVSQNKTIHALDDPFRSGTYSATLSEDATDVLVTGTGAGEKFVHAQKWGIPCVTEEWVKQSADVGYALKYSNFIVPPSKTSTPDNNKTFTDLNCSMVSMIGEVNKRHVINETVMSDASFLEPGPPRSSRLPSQSGMRASRNTMQPPKTIPDSLGTQGTTQRTPEKIGPFLDGCKVYLSGFPPSSVDGIRKILNCAGATRLDRISEEVSHVIVAGAALSSEEQRAVRACDATIHVVKVAWLSRSLQLRQMASIDSFLCYEAQSSLEPSPLSKKGLQMWQQSAHSNESRVSQETVAQADINLVKQYIDFNGDALEVDTNMSPAKQVEEEEELAKPLNEEPTNDEEMETATEVEGEEEEEPNKIFKDLNFWGVGLSKEELAHFASVVKSYGGSWQQRNIDYLIVPQKGARTKCQRKETVTQLWIEDCVEQDTIVPVEYYHKPWDYQSHENPLKGCVLAISSYLGKERIYLSNLASDLGAKFQEVFAKKRAPERNAEASTHLLCPTPTGDKYRAAVKWKLPVITKDWLIACAQDGRHVEEEPFLLEGSVMAPKTDLTPGRKAPDTPVMERTPAMNSLISDSRDSYAMSAAKQQPTDSPKSSLQKPPAEDTMTPLSAVPTRLRQAAKTPFQDPPKADVNTTPSNMKTPDNANRSVQFTTPTEEVRTPSQQYTPYIPPQLKPGYTALNVKTPGSATVDVANMTPNSFEQYWDKKVPGYMPTPDTPYGAALQKDDPTPTTKKVWKKFANSIPDAFKSNANVAIDTETSLLATTMEATATKVREMEREENSSHLFSSSTPSTKRDFSLGFLENESNQGTFVEISKPYKFMMTGIDETMTKALENVIRELKGECCEVSTFDPTATHLIACKPTRSEKLLASIASGKWIVNHRFLMDSHKQKGFLSEEEYEWGNPIAKILPGLQEGSVIEKLAAASYRWRVAVQESNRGAFFGMKAIVHGSNSRVDSIKRLIQAGGGVVLDISPPYSDPEDATHFFSDLKGDTSQIDIVALSRKNIPVLNFFYLNDFLMNNPSPTPQQWLQSYAKKR